MDLDIVRLVAAPFTLEGRTSSGSRRMLEWIPTGGAQPDPDLESASPRLLRRRAIAAAIDIVVCYVIVEAAILAVLMVAYTSYFLERPGEAIALSIVGLIPVYLLYSLYYEWRYGWTPGKKRMDILVASPQGSPPEFTAVAIRNAFRYVDWLPAGYLLGWLVARRSSRGRRIGDRVAGTVVVRPVTAAAPLLPNDDARSADGE